MEVPPDPLQLPSPCLVVLVGPGASGKSTWAAAHFPPETIVSSDALRSLVGSGPDDISATVDAFELLDSIVEARLRRGLTTVIDTLGLDAAKRRAWLEAASRWQVTCVAVTFGTPAGECRARNRERAKPVPSAALSAQLRNWTRTREQLPTEGFDAVIPAAPVRVVPSVFATAAASARRQAEAPVGLRFGLHIGSFTFPGGPSATRQALREVAASAESAGFDAIYVMDHFRQIPQVGRQWEDFLESYTTLAFLAGCTERARLGALVTGITYRNLAHLGKIIATLDVLSGARAVCGLGLAWFRDEHTAYGWEFPSNADRYALLEDALRLLPLLWGAGSPSYEGLRVNVPEAMCYPRPLQKHVPVLVGGGGERRTLRLAARYADGANVMGDLSTVRRKAAVLQAHCRVEGRDPAAVQLTHLSSVLVGADDRHVAELVEQLRPRGRDRGRASAALNAGTVRDHVGRFRELADAGVAEVMVRLVGYPGSGPGPGSIEQMASVISAFR
jgi:alkanesulfonate monooxygenase SsuD/methylene tetrahydromethanopterin reductase-like flavin-dependent oxidoreductase (luciferase family)/predicted kinase